MVDWAAAGGEWEVGATLTGVVTFWNMKAGWGKIKRAAGDGGGGKSGRKREIFVHNTQLPMDARRRWLRRGEEVSFIVGIGAAGKGPQATVVVAASPEFWKGNAPPLLLCQQVETPQPKHTLLTRCSSLHHLLS